MCGIYKNVAIRFSGVDKVSEVALNRLSRAEQLKPRLAELSRVQVSHDNIIVRHRHHNHHHYRHHHHRKSSRGCRRVMS